MASHRLGQRPPLHPWTVAIHDSPTGGAPLGTGFVVDSRHVLTAGHVVRAGSDWREHLWVSFPLATNVPIARRCRVARCAPEWPNDTVDVALLELEEGVPRQVPAARLRYPTAADVFGQSWWAFGFPNPLGEQAQGTLGAGLAYGVVKLHATDPHRIQPGFSGGALWSREQDAVVGIVIDGVLGGAQAGDGRAVTLAYVEQQLPELKLATMASWQLHDLDEDALSAWGWSLQDDPELGRHWSPRARGVATESQAGYHFRGRRVALTEIRDWLDRPEPDNRILVVTGSPGVGKSAVLSRIVTTADAAIQKLLLTRRDGGVQARIGSIGCAVHAKGKTALEVCLEIARAASIGIPRSPEELVQMLRDRLTERVRRFNVVVDALDEAATPDQTRLILKTLRRLVRDCGQVGLQVVVGSRRSDDQGDLLRELPDASVIDLDEPRYVEDQDIVAYAQSTLQLVGAERPDSPYANDAAALPVAIQIGTLANGNFLVAGLVARSHGVYDTVSVDPAQIAFSSNVDDTLDAFVRKLAAAGTADARAALTVLAHAEAPGLPLDLWRDGLAALGYESTVEELAAFATSSAANFLIEHRPDEATPAYRLFHQALNDGLLRRRATVASLVEDETRLVDDWLASARRSGWAETAPYLRRSLASHAARCDRVDDLLTDDGFLQHADLRRLMVAAETARSPLALARARMVRRTPWAVDAGPAERAAMFSATQSIEDLAAEFVPPADAPYVARWANTPPGLAFAILAGHADAVRAACAVDLGDTTLVASAGEDGTVRLWSPVTGQTERILAGHQARVQAVCQVPVPGSTLIASGGDDTTVRIWDARTGEAQRTLTGHTDWIRGVCALSLGGQPLVASASDDRTVRLWDPLTGETVRVLSGLIGWASAVCAVPAAEGTLLASGGYDGAITLWNPFDGRVVRSLTGHATWVTAVTTVVIDGRTWLVSSAYDATVKVWDVDSGTVRHTWRVDPARPVTGVCAVRCGGRTVLAASAEDGRLMVYDPADPTRARTLNKHTRWTTGVCAVPVGAADLVASTSEDGTVRLWDPATGKSDKVLDGGRVGPIEQVCGVEVDGRELLASTADSGAVQLWDPLYGGDPVRTIAAHTGPVTSVCPVVVRDRPLLVSAGQDHRLVLWDPATGLAEEQQFDNPGDWVIGACYVPVHGRDLLATVGDDQTVRLWNLATGLVERELYGHTEWVHAICVVPTADGPMLASGSHDGTIRLWDPAAGKLIRVVTGHHGAIVDVCAVPTSGGHLLASAGADRIARLWYPETGRPAGVLEGHGAEVTAVCPVPGAGTDALVATASRDRMVRLWEPTTGALITTIPVHHAALSCRVVSGRLIVGLETGMIALDINVHPTVHKGHQ